MPKIQYRTQKFSAGTRAIIDHANVIIAEYQAQGFDLTLRQLYYQFVSRDLIANTQQEYKRLGSIINDARLAGLIDWNTITDRTRNLQSISHWTSPANIIRSAAASFRIDKWARQPCRIEIWIEKEALAGVFDRVCRDLDLPYFCCRGYTSQSEMWAAAQRLLDYMKKGQRPIILHFGDHDPSGVDMTRDVEDRLALFTEQDWLNQMDLKGEPSATVKEIRDDMERVFGGRGVEVRRLALNMDQVHEYNPPPNPAKTTDARARGYIAIHGDESWELDALNPTTLANIVSQEVETIRDDEIWEEDARIEADHREQLARASNRWSEVVDFLE